MQRAIAARRRLCQAVALAVALIPLPALSQATPPTFSEPEPPYAEVRTPDGIVVRENCLAKDAIPARQRTCGALARKGADVLARLRPMLGPLPDKSLDMDRVLFQEFVALESGTAPSPSDDYHFALGDLFLPDFLPRGVARHWFQHDESRSRIGDRGLAEGLPEYLAWRYLREASPEVARALVAEALRDSVAGDMPSQAFGSLTATVDADATRRLTERQRGLLVLRTLETVIDRERVDRVLPLLVNRYGSNPFSLQDFERVCEEVAGRDLGWFFRYFFYRKGIPEIEMRRLPSESPGVVAGEIVVHGLPLEGSVRVDMAVRTAKGTVEHSVATRGEVTPFTVNVPAPAIEIVLDPDQRVLRWTEAARKSQAQSQILAEVPNPISRKNVSDAIALYRRALEADPEDASLRAQSLRERLGELEWAHDKWQAALADLDTAIDGHSITPYETYLTRGKAHLYHGVVSLHEQRPKEALEDARAGLALPLPVLETIQPREPIESRGWMTLQQLLETLQQAATHY